MPTPKPSPTKLWIFLAVFLTIFALILLAIFQANNQGRLLSAGLYLDFIEKPTQGLGQYHLFFRGDAPQIGENRLQDIPNTGDGTLPLSSDSLTSNPTLLSGGSRSFFIFVHPLHLYELAIRNLQHKMIAASDEHHLIPNISQEILVRLTPEQNYQLRNIITPTPNHSSSPGASPSPSPASTGLPPIVYDILPSLQRIDDSLVSINPVIPNMPDTMKPDAAAIDRWFILQLNTEEKEGLVERLRSTLEFEVVELVQLAQAHFIPNDPYFSSRGSWGQQEDDLWGLKNISLPAAWDVTVGSRDTVVAVIDSGIYAHPDIMENIWINEDEIRNNQIDDDNNGYIDDWMGWNFVHKNNLPLDDDGHGTHIAGIIAALGNNGQGITGVMHQAAVMPLKSLNWKGSGISPNLAAAIRYAAANGAVAINNSWGSFRHVSVINDALVFAHEGADSVVVASAGNEKSSSISYPASSDHVIAVGASGPDDRRVSFSNYGDGLDVVAPGGGGLYDPAYNGYSHDIIDSILSLRVHIGAGGGCWYVNVNLCRWSGTSMAAPHVTGLAGLIRTLHPNWSADQVISTILETADDVGPPGFDQETGWGRINAARAVGALAPAINTADINQDGRISEADWNLVISCLGSTSQACRSADVDGNGVISPLDASLVQQQLQKISDGQ